MTYLLNSGFLVRVGRTLLVFDDFKDPAGAVDAAAAAADFDHLYFFASHSHFDHFDAHIQRYEAQADRYILSDDIRCMKDCSAFNPQKLTFLKPYANWQDDVLAVESFDSTDLAPRFASRSKRKARPSSTPATSTGGTGRVSRPSSGSSRRTPSASR